MSTNPSTLSHQAKCIEIGAMFADVCFIPSEGADIEIQAQSDLYICSHPTIVHKNDKLSISYPIPLKNGTYIDDLEWCSINKINQWIYIDNNRVDSRRKIKLTIRIPLGTKIITKHVLGYISVADTKSPLAVSGDTGFSMDVASASNSELILSGGFDMTIKNVTGSLKIHSSSGSSLKIESATGADAKIVANSAAKISIKEVLFKDLNIRADSGSYISFESGTVDDITCNASAGAKQNLQVKANHANLRGSSGSKTVLKSCTTTPQTYMDSGAKIIIES